MYDGVEGHMADNQSTHASNGCARLSKGEVIVTRWCAILSNIKGVVLALSKVVVLSRITTIYCSIVVILYSNSQFKFVYQTQGIWYCIRDCLKSKTLSIIADRSTGVFF